MENYIILYNPHSGGGKGLNIAKEIETEKDRNYIISVFSGIVSFAALIVALVALFKEVG